jgi:peptidyl-tRNA hydrolase, PTH1 family
VWLVVGLGNPGARYARTRHNVAWRTLDELAARHAMQDVPEHATFRARRTTLAGRTVELLQPLTFMNLSGEALAAWREREGSEAALLVVSDDVYLPLGRLRLRARGSSGGHRGLESIEAAVGRDYDRLRIGVGAVDAAALREHVLEEFAPEEEPVLAEAIRRAADAVECWVAEGILGAMNRFNRREDPGQPSDGGEVEGVRQEESES